MIRTHRWAALVLLALVAVGCAATQAGSGVAAPAHSTTPATETAPAGMTLAPAITVPSSSSAAVEPVSPRSTATAPPLPLAGAATDIAAFGVCPNVAGTDESGVAQCLGRSLSSFWSGRLGKSIGSRVVVNPTADQVPAACRSALTTAPAFTCQVDNIVYLDPTLTTLVDGHFQPEDRPYALAVVLAHEFGHVIQATVDQPGYGDSSPAMSQRIEQQADCLSGVWAHQQSVSGALGSARFTADQHTLITAISDQTEVDSHGSPSRRAAALAKGLKDGLQQDCALGSVIAGTPVA